MNAAGTVTRLETCGYDDQSRLISLSAPDRSDSADLAVAEGVIHYGYDPITGQLTDTWTSSGSSAAADDTQMSIWTHYAGACPDPIGNSLGRCRPIAATGWMAGATKKLGVEHTMRGEGGYHGARKGQEP